MTQQGLRTEQLDYELPRALIAARPAEPRDSARMLVMSRTGESIEHARVRDLPQFLHAGDALVLNTSAVAPARLLGRRADTEGRVEGLFV
ncbi:MAG: S-adenosylmethionine:tRNA ribosyltransferase-isomerase, partial [Planctomycetota bacterium]